MKTIADYPMPEIYRLSEVCELLRIHRGTAYRMIKTGQLRTMCVARHHRVTSLEVERIMAEQGIYAPPRKKI